MRALFLLLLALVLLALLPAVIVADASYCASTSPLTVLDAYIPNPNAVPYNLSTPSIPECRALCCRTAGCVAFSLSLLPSPSLFPCLLHQAYLPSHPHPNFTSAFVSLSPSPSSTPVPSSLHPSTRLLDPLPLSHIPPWSAPDCSPGCASSPGCLAAVGLSLSPHFFNCSAVGFFTGLAPGPPSSTVFLVGRSQPQPSPLNSTSPLSKPIRGWNTYDFYGSVPSEAQVLLTAKAMVTHLLPAGYRLVSLDWGWWFTLDGSTALDDLGRYQPAPDRFPSAKGGAGFRPLADQLHSMGLLFGIYTDAGFSIFFNNTGPHHIPNGTQCVWPGNAYFLDFVSPAAQAWLDGVVQQWVDWGVDYLKVDCVGSITDYQQALMYSTAIARSTNPDLMLSISPGYNGDWRSERTIAGYVSQYRLQVDFHDLWDEPISFYPSLPQQVDAAAQLEGLYPGLPLVDPRVGGVEGGGQGAGGVRLSFGDLDILPFGWIRSMAKGGNLTWSAFNVTQQRTVFSVWCFYRSPLLYGGSLLEGELDMESIGVVTNAEVLHVQEVGYGTETAFVEHTWLTVWTGREELGERFVLLANINSTAVWRQTVTARGDGERCDWREAWTGRVEMDAAFVEVALQYSEVHVWTLTNCKVAAKVSTAEQPQQTEGQEQQHRRRRVADA